jgi:hypothetical protein
MFPPPELCTGRFNLIFPDFVELLMKRVLDNAVMIAWASMHRFAAGNTDDYGILIRPKWSIEDLMGDETAGCAVAEYEYKAHVPAQRAEPIQGQS